MFLHGSVQVNYTTLNRHKMVKVGRALS